MNAELIALAALLGVEPSDVQWADDNLTAGDYPDDGRAEDETEYMDWLEANGLDVPPD